MTFRSLDLGSYHLQYVQFSLPLTKQATRELVAVLEDSPEDLHWRGWHPYTIYGDKYWADFHILQRGDGQEEDDRPYGFVTTLQSGEPEDPQGDRIVRRVAKAMINMAGEIGPSEPLIESAYFSFPTGEYTSPIIPSASPIDFEEETPDLPEKFWLRPTGMRYSAEEGLLDVIVDTTHGPVTVQILRAVQTQLSLKVIREEIKDLHDFAELFVDRKPAEKDDEG